MFSCKYGYFSHDGYEYIITTPKTPKPWSNIISNGEYSILVTQTGGGYSWGRNSIENRVTRFVQDSVKDDFGKYFYIRDDDTKEVWGFTYKPLDKCGDDYSVTYGLGYAIFTHTYNGIKSTLKVFLSKDYSVEFYVLTLENLTSLRRRLSVFSYVELYMSNFPEESREFDKLFTESRFDKSLNCLLFRKRFWGVIDKEGKCNNREYDYLFFMSSTYEIISYDTSKESFIGMYSSLSDPKSLKSEKLLNIEGENLHSIASVHISLELLPNEKKSLSIYMGICKSQHELNEVLNTYNSIERIEEELTRFNKYIRNFIDQEKIETPDKSIDFMVNIWCKYQTIMSRFFGKASYYQVNKGVGFRDHIQDSMIFLTNESEVTKSQILKQCNMQFLSGKVIHFLLDESNYFVETNSSDDNLWLIYVTCIYINETGDEDILNEGVSYIDSTKKDSVYIHLKKSIEYSLSNLSERGLSLILNHDWNDAISSFTGESIFVSEFLYLNLKEFIPICIIKNDQDFLNTINNHMEKLKESVNKFGFDKKWYVRALNSHVKLGSYQEGRIFLLPQAFGVISSICDTKIQTNIMNEVYKRLNTKFGLKILNPPYDKVDRNIGYITRYSKGVRENGSIYYHSCMWGILAFILIDNMVYAENIIREVNPINKSYDIDLYKIEPYVMPSSVEGDYSDNFGLGNWSFNTGSSVWFHRIITNFVLGVRGTMEGLLIDPKPFESWERFSITKKCRGAVFNIEFENLKGKNIDVYVDGERIKGNIIKNIKKNMTYNVKVILNN